MARNIDFERLVAENVDGLRRYVAAILRDPVEAEDVLQEALLRAWRYLPAWRGDAPIEAWLMRICRNAALDEVRRRSRRPSTVPLDDDGTVVDGGFARVEAADLLGRLALEHREVLVLVDVLGWDYRSTADVLEVPVGTVRSRLSRARAALSEQSAERRSEDIA